MSPSPADRNWIFHWGSPIVLPVPTPHWKFITEHCCISIRNYATSTAAADTPPRPSNLPSYYWDSIQYCSYLVWGDWETQQAELQAIPIHDSWFWALCLVCVGLASCVALGENALSTTEKETLFSGLFECRGKRFTIHVLNQKPKFDNNTGRQKSRPGVNARKEFYLRLRPQT